MNKIKVIMILFLLLIYFCPNTFGYYANEVSFYNKWKFENKPIEEFSTPWYGYPANVTINKDDSIVYTTYSNRFVALNLDTGEEIFSVCTPNDKVFANFVVDKDSIFIVQCPRDSNELIERTADVLIKLNKHTGEEIWRRDIIPASFLFDGKDSLIVASSCCPYLIYISKDEGITVKEIILSYFYVKNKRYLSFYPYLIKEKYLYWILSPANKDESILEALIFDTDANEQITGISINIEIQEEAFYKIIYIDEDNIIVEKFADKLCWYGQSELICYNFEKKDIIWKKTFSEENHIRTIFTSNANEKAYYLICKSGLIISINKKTGENIDECVLIQNEINKISSKYIYYPIGVSTWREYAWFRLEYTVFMVNLKTEKLVFKLWEGEEYSYLDIKDGIFLSTAPISAIIVSQNADNEIDLLVPLGNQLIRGTLFIRKLPNLIRSNSNSRFEAGMLQIIDCLLGDCHPCIEFKT